MGCRSCDLHYYNNQHSVHTCDAFLLPGRFMMMVLPLMPHTGLLTQIQHAFTSWVHRPQPSYPGNSHKYFSVNNILTKCRLFGALFKMFALHADHSGILETFSSNTLNIDNPIVFLPFTTITAHTGSHVLNLNHKCQDFFINDMLIIHKHWLQSLPERNLRIMHLGLSVRLSVCPSVCPSVRTRNSKLLLF